MMCFTPSLGLLGLCRGGSIDGEEVLTAEWYPPDEDVFSSYPGGGHGTFPSPFLTLLRQLKFNVASGYMYTTWVLACCGEFY
jgi:hypothetical protein